MTAAHDYPDWEGLPRRTLLLCTQPRSGSTLLGEAMHASGTLGCPLEYFHMGFQPGLAARWNAAEPDAYLAAVCRHRTTTGGVLAVKLFWHDLVQLAQALRPADFAWSEASRPEALSDSDYRALHDFVTETFPNPSLIYLHRVDRLRQAISGATAMVTGRWRDLGEPADAESPVIDLDRVAHYLGHGNLCHDHWRRLFAATGATPFEITYEALAADYSGTVKALYTWLECDAEVQPARLRRQADAASDALLLRYLREKAHWTPLV